MTPLVENDKIVELRFLVKMSEEVLVDLQALSMSVRKNINLTTAEKDNIIWGLKTLARFIMKNIIETENFIERMPKSD